MEVRCSVGRGASIINSQKIQIKFNKYHHESKFNIFVALEQSKQNIIQINDIGTYEELFRSHYANLCSYANKYIEDLDAAEEIVQDVFVKLWENRDSIEISSNFQSYIFRAVRNSCLNLIKHINIREEYKAYNQQELELSQHNLEEEIHASELENKIRETIDQLPLERRKVFIMSRYDGLKYREIAEKLNISDKTVENQMGKAIKFLKQHLVKYITISILYIINLITGNGWG